MKETWIYLDDVRTPAEMDGREWVVVRNYHEFVESIQKFGLENIDGISFDHDLGPDAMREYYENVRTNYTLNYENINELTGYEACKWLIDHYYEKNPERISMERSEKKKNVLKFPKVTVHSANPIGAANIIGYVNNFFKNEAARESCYRCFWEITEIENS